MKRLLAVAVVFAAMLSFAGHQAQAIEPQLPQPTIYVVNSSTSVTDEQLADALPAFQLAVDQDFRRYWNVGALLVVATSPVPKGSWMIVLADDLFCFGCGGFHSVQPGFIPYGEVLADPDWQVAFTHELFEMLADPRANRAIVTPNGECDASTGKPCVSHWLEVADPVESRSYTRPGADGLPVRISDFVTERWWDVGALRGPFDIMGLVHRPLQVLSGGYEGQYR